MLDGATGSLTAMTHRGVARGPQWSHDGLWLAFVRTTRTPYGTGRGRLWLVRCDGSDLHAVGGPAGNGGSGPSGANYTWSPRGDVLAVAPQTSARTNGLWLVPTSGAARLLALGSDFVGSFL